MYFIRSVAGSYGLISAVQPPVVIHFTYVRNAFLPSPTIASFILPSCRGRLFRFDSRCALSFESRLLTAAISYVKGWRL